MMNTIDIPNGVEATVAVYRDHKLPEYNANPMIQALPHLMTEDEFLESVIWRGDNLHNLDRTRATQGDRLIITIDRTQWKDSNISMVSVIWNKRALPIYWLLLDKKGSSNFYEQVA